MKNLLKFVPILFLVACTSNQQAGCSRSIATEFGADWVIAQYDMNGKPFNCWKLTDVSVNDEAHSDGVWWQSFDGHLVHISGWYNRVQVSNGDYAKAATSVGVNIKYCVGGEYHIPTNTDSE